MSLSNFRIRSITALIFAILMIGSLLLHPKLFALVIIIFAIQGFLEYARLIEKGGYKLNLYAGFIFGIILFITQIAISIELVDPSFNVVLLLIPFLLLAIELFRSPVNPFGNSSLALLGILWIFLPMSLFASMANSNHGVVTGSDLIFGFLSIVWVSDSAAYIVGSLIGKNPLYLKVSSGKTWEGALGGLIFGIVAAWLFSIVSNNSLFFWLQLAVIIIITGIIGDLAESLLKRSFKAKDSGSLLPGHGGVLDRFDSILFSAPFVWIYLQFAA